MELTVGDVGLELGPESTEGRYRFHCPHCGLMQRRPASRRVVSVLLATGVSYEIVPDPGPITEAEIAEFAVALEGDWHEELAATDG